MQTFTSDYGRKGCRVPDRTPTRAIDHHLDRIHVGTPVQEIRDEVAREITRQVINGAQGWTPELSRATLRYAEWRHLENRAQYAWVMGSH